jgi:hypothetical protein
MDKFIEVTTRNGKKELFNTAIIEKILPATTGGGSVIYINALSKSAYNQIDVHETYEHLKKELL